MYRSLKFYSLTEGMAERGGGGEESSHLSGKWGGGGGGAKFAPILKGYDNLKNYDVINVSKENTF